MADDGAFESYNRLLILQCCLYFIADDQRGLRLQ